MRKLLLSMFAVLCAGVVYAQNSQISGTVTDADNGEPMMLVTVHVEGGAGTVTDTDGKYSLSVPQNASLTFSFMGYKTQTVAVAGKSVINVMLEPDSEMLEDVVITAMGVARSEKAIGYSATSIGGDDIALQRSSDIMSSLAGKVAGVQIKATSSDPGSSQSVVIRGVSSLSGSNQPLYVVDGVPLNNTSVYSSDGLNSGYDFGNGANAVNPDDVENMTILKGAAATALYGSRAAGGVVMITTKSGKKHVGKGIGIEYNGGMQWTSVLRLPQMQNDFGMGWYGDKTDNENGSWGPRFDGTTQIYGNVYNNSQRLKPFVAMEDNVKDFFDTGVRYSNSVSFNGATNVSDYFVSFSQISDNGIVPTKADSYDKYTFSARGSHKVGKLTFSSSLNYAMQKNSFATTGQGLSMYNSVMQTPRDISLIALKDLDNPFNSPGYFYTPYGVTNPYYVLENYMNQYESERFYGKFEADYDISKSLKFIYRLGLDTSTGQRDMGEPNLEMLFANTPNWSNAFVGELGAVSQQISRRSEINHDIMLTFNKKIEDLQINALAGFNGNERKNNTLFSSITDLTIPTWYNLSNSSKSPQTTTDSSKRRLMGAYGQVEGAWKEMLFLTLTARNDWSSTLPEANRSFFYPGVTASFLFTELLSDDIKEVLSFGKIRAAWGKTGNDAAPYMVNSVYAQSGATGFFTAEYNFPYLAKGYNAYTVGNIIGSNTLSPEMTTEAEVGLLLAFFNNRFSIDAAYYNRNTDKQIYSLNMDPASGSTAQNMNLGKVENKGIELLVSATPIQTKNFAWDISWNFTKNWNKVISLPEELGGEALIYGFSGGTSMYAVVGEPVGVFRAQVPQMTPDGKIIVNPSTGLPVPEAELKTVGNMNYDYQMGISTGVSYKGIRLSADLDIRKGGVMFSRTKDINYFTGNAIQTAYNSRNPFIIPNTVVDNGDGTYSENTTPLDNTTIYNYFDGGGSMLESSFLLDKSYMKLRSVNLSWDMPSKYLKNIPLNNVRLSAYGNNLFVWTPASNTFIDPEMTSFGNDLEGNFGEYSANPSTRSFGFNVMVKF